jgi:SAM-dependent methyltransferase
MNCDHPILKNRVRGIRDWELAVPGDFSYAQCQQCGLVLLQPMPKIQDLVSYYPNDYPAFQIGSKEKGFLYRQLYKLKSWGLRKKLGKFITLQNAHVFDVGCGSGDMLLQFQDWGAKQLVGVDFSPVACEIANSKKNIKALCGTFLDLHLEKYSFDIVLMHHYIEHTLDPLAELKKAREILKPGGTLILELPNFLSFDQSLFGRFWGGNHCPRHTFQFEAPVLEKYLKDAGFTHVHVKHEINPAHFALSIQNFIQYLKHKENPVAVPGGRSWYFSLLLLVLVPIQILSIIFKRSGMISVVAK